MQGELQSEKKKRTAYLLGKIRENTACDLENVLTTWKAEKEQQGRMSQKAIWKWVGNRIKSENKAFWLKAHKKR